MDILQEILPGCFLIKPQKHADHRGWFVKTYHEALYERLGICFTVREEFISISHKNVLRGMHFQLPPHDHDKLVYCANGLVLDVLLDLRMGAGYGKVASAQISSENNQIIFIPKGVAHGFLALSDQALMIYKTSTTHAPESDFGIAWDSFEFDWGIDQPIASERDHLHIPFHQFSSPF